MRSSYRNKIPIEPTYVRTILREFGADTVHMPLGKGGYRYVVDLRDKFSGWVEAQALCKANSANVADFIFSVMCRFGCLVKLTVDNGSEFKGAVTLLAEKYNMPLIPISPYNPPVNRSVERGHRVYIESIWRVLQGRTQDWPHVLQLAVWADRITAKHTTGHSPYFLLYGQQPLLAFHITDRSWHTLEWTKVKSTKDLLAIRIKQLSRRDEYIGEASARAEKSRKKAAEYFYEKNKARMSSGEFAPGTFVLVWNNPLDFQFGNKGALRWHGPYIIVQRRKKGAYVLAELDGTVLMKPFAARRLKLYHYRDHKDPIVAIEWQHHVEEDYDILEETDDNADEYEISRLVVRKVKVQQGPKLPRPWELRGKQCDEYWQKVYDDWMSGETERRLIANELPDWEKAIVDFHEEDNQFWDYRWDYRDVDVEDIPRWKTPPTRPQLFIWKRAGDWLPPGPPEFAHKTMIANLISNNGDGFLRLGEPIITIQYAIRSVVAPQGISPFTHASFVTRYLPDSEDFPCHVTNVTVVKSINAGVTTHNGGMASVGMDTGDSYQSYTNKKFHVPGAGIAASLSESIEDAFSAARDILSTVISLSMNDDPPKYKNASSMVYEEVELTKHSPFLCLMSNARAPPDYSARANDSRRSTTRNTTSTPSHYHRRDSDTLTMRSETPADVTPQWTPYVRVSEKDSDVLEEIRLKLHAMLTVTDGVLDVARKEFPRIEETIASTSDALQSLVSQLVDTSHAFREVKLQLQARTEAINNTVNTLTMDIDSLRALLRNIRSDDFETSDYLELFVNMASRVHLHMAKTHNPDGEDLMDFREFTRHAIEIVMKLDPSTH